MDFTRLKHWLIQTSAKPWLDAILLFLITLLAAGLRLYKLGEWSFWIDEIYTINHALRHFGSLDLIMQNIPPARNWVPISIILTAQALNIWGVSEWGARLVPALLGIFTIPILYFPTKKIFGKRTALFSGLLLAVAPWHIYWSQNARFYTSLLLIYSLALFAFYYGMERNRAEYFFLFYVLFYLGFSERLLAIFIVPVFVFYFLGLWIFNFEKPAGLNYRNIILLSIPVLVGLFIEGYSRIAIGESRFFGDFGWFFIYLVDDPIRLLGNISFNTGIPLMVMAMFSGVLIIKNKDRAGLLMLISSAVPLMLLLAVNQFIFTKDRYIFLSLYSWIILAAIGISNLSVNKKGWQLWVIAAILTILVADAAADNLLYYRFNYGNRDQWKTAFTIVQDQIEPEDAVVVYWPELGSYYMDREIIPYDDLELQTILNSGMRYWFVLDAETIWLNEEVKTMLEKDAVLINVLYLRRPDENYLRIYLYDPKS